MLHTTMNVCISDLIFQFSLFMLICNKIYCKICYFFCTEFLHVVLTSLSEKLEQGQSPQTYL